MGQLVGDFQASVVGRLNTRSRMIPIEVRIRSTELKVDDVYRMQGTSMPVAVPMVLATAVGASLQHSIPHILPYHYKVTTRWTTQEGFRGEEVGFAVSDSPKTGVVRPVLGPISRLAANPFEVLGFTGFEVDIEVIPDRKIAGISRLSVPVEEIVAGETVNVQVHLKPFGQQKEVIEVLSLEIPDEYAGHEVRLTVGASNALLRPHKARPVDLKSYIDFLKSTGSPHELALVFDGQRQDVDKDGVLYKTPPPSMLAGLRDPQLSPSPRRIRHQHVSLKTIPWLIAGQGVLHVKVVKNVR